MLRCSVARWAPWVPDSIKSWHARWLSRPMRREAFESSMNLTSKAQDSENTSEGVMCQSRREHVLGDATHLCRKSAPWISRQLFRSTSGQRNIEWVASCDGLAKNFGKLTDERWKPRIRTRELGLQPRRLSHSNAWRKQRLWSPSCHETTRAMKSLHRRSFLAIFFLYSTETSCAPPQNKKL